jgi:hypothetical protein
MAPDEVDAEAQAPAQEETAASDGPEVTPVVDVEASTQEEVAEADDADVTPGIDVSGTTGSTATQCGTCGATLTDAKQQFCNACGAAQDDGGYTGVTFSGAELKKMEELAASLVGQEVVFRTLSRRDRALRAEPNPAAPVLENYLVGRCQAAEAAGAWVRVVHSTGVTGWCPAMSLREYARRPEPAARLPRQVAPRPVVPAAGESASEASRTRAVAETPKQDSQPNERNVGMIEALERLHLLHASGALTDEEFARAKETLFTEGSI